MCGRSLRSRQLTRVALCALFGAAAGCGEAEPPGIFVPPVLEDCPGVPAEACDIRALECQAGILAVTACLRETEPPEMPPVETISVDDYRARLEGRVSTSTAHLGLEWSVVQLGLAKPQDFWEPSRVEARVDAVAAFYDAGQDRVFIIDHEGERGPDLTASILAHELVHYLQDQEHDLSAVIGNHAGTHDEYLAVLSLIEGEAELYQHMFLASTWGLPAEVRDYRGRFDVYAKRLEEEVAEDPAIFVGPAQFPYVHGARYVSEMWQRFGQAGIQAEFAGPPSSTFEVMTEVERTSPTAPQANGTPPGHALVEIEQLGAWMLFAFLQGRLSGPQALALGWVNDRLYVYRHLESEDSPAFVWQIEMRTEAQAARLALASQPPVTSLRAGRVVYLTASQGLSPTLWREAVTTLFGL